MSLVLIPQIARFRFLSLVGLIGLSAGCCVYPLQDDKGPTFSRSFYGATLNPNESVRIQARSLGGQWETVDTVQTAETPEIGWGGLRYHAWYSHNLAIPSRFWRDTYGISVNLCEVRILDSSGNHLYTYSDRWSVADMDLNPVDVWREKGNRDDYLRLWQHRHFD